MNEGNGMKMREIKIKKKLTGFLCLFFFKSTDFIQESRGKREDAYKDLILEYWEDSEAI